MGDFEAGADVVLFDDLDGISSGKAIPITRTSKYGTVKLTDLVPNQRLGKSLSC